MADSKKQIYWLTSEVKDYQTQCSFRLERIGYETVFFTSVPDLQIALRKKRVLLILVSDVGERGDVEKMRQDCSM